MLTIFIIIGIIVLGIILSLIHIPRTMDPKRRDSFFKFLITLLATLAGVFLAFQISNYQEIQDEKDFLVALLDQSASKLESEIEYVETNHLPIIESKQDSTDFERFVNLHPIRGIVSLDILLNSTLLPRFGSPSSSGIHVANRDLADMRTVINSTSADLSVRLELVRPYVQLMSLTRELLLTEISYVRGVMSDEEVSERYKTLR